MIIFSASIIPSFQKIIFSKFFMKYNRILQAGAFRIVRGKVQYVSKVSDDIVPA
jgi:hypothetical protein